MIIRTATVDIRDDGSRSYKADGLRVRRVAAGRYRFFVKGGERMMAVVMLDEKWGLQRVTTYTQKPQACVLVDDRSPDERPVPLVIRRASSGKWFALVKPGKDQVEVATYEIPDVPRPLPRKLSDKLKAASCQRASMKEADAGFHLMVYDLK